MRLCEERINKAFEHEALIFGKLIENLLKLYADLCDGMNTEA